MSKKFVGFGFGAIQGGLYLFEAYASGNFEQLTVAEVMPEVVSSLRATNGAYHLNIAGNNGVTQHEIRNVTVWNPQHAADRRQLIEAVAAADEIATALPSVNFYGAGEPGSPVDILSAGLQLRWARKMDQRSVIYTAENHNHAAEILWEQLAKRLQMPLDWTRQHVQCLNTVIGKMSGVVTDPAQIQEQNLAPLTPASNRCLLVEKFNRILISAITLPAFQRGITVFAEKANLLPFEEAKLYGHNATHALIGYLARLKGLQFMADAATDTALVKLAREAFIAESGRALCKKHAGVDELFTPNGYQAYAEDLLERMLNPHLRDAVSRVIRDPLRKLGWDDRLVGTVRLALKQNITPKHYLTGVAAALRVLQEQYPNPEHELQTNWRQAGATATEIDQIMAMIPLQ